MEQGERLERIYGENVLNDEALMNKCGSSESLVFVVLLMKTDYKTHNSHDTNARHGASTHVQYKISSRN